MKNTDIINALKEKDAYKKLNFVVGDTDFCFVKTIECYGDYFEGDYIDFYVDIERDEEDVVVTIKADYPFVFDHFSLTFLDRCIRYGNELVISDCVHFNPVIRLSTDHLEFNNSSFDLENVEGRLEISYRVLDKYVNDGNYYVELLSKMINASIHILDYMADWEAIEKLLRQSGKQ